jgi:magnesium transporter
MIENLEITVAFIRKRPEAAGRVLASMRPAVAAAFLQSIPTRFAVDAVARMNPQPASMLVEQMDVVAGAALLRDLSFAQASTMLRRIEPAVRNQLLQELPRRQRRDFEMSLAFPADTVGAHMTTAIATLAENDKATDALELVRQMETDATDVIFVVDDHQKLAGAANITTLLRRQPDAPLEELIDRSCVTLSAYARLDSVADDAAWLDYNHLPVVSRRGEVIGTLSRKMLSRSHLHDHIPNGAGEPNLTDSMIGALTTSTLGLFSLLTSSFGTSTELGDFDER